jgi:phosphoglycerate dehydrogenase-like enzyme
MERFWILDADWPNYDAEIGLLRQRHPGCEVRISPLASPEELGAFGGEADAVICQINVPVGRALMESLKKCKVISVYGAGFDNVDAEAAGELGIAVTNVPGYCAEDMADYVIAAIYRHNLRLDYYASHVKNGLWGVGAAERKPRRLAAQTLLILGFGRIGRRAAEKASAIGMRILYCDCMDIPEMSAFAEKIGAQRVSLDDGISRADVISVHMALTAETRGFFSDKIFERMKPNAHFINASRGGVVDEPALIRAVRGGVIAAATLDVVVNEPPRPDEPILNTDNISVTPHISFLSEDSLEELKVRAARNASDVLLGKDIPEIVNKR